MGVVLDKSLISNASTESYSLTPTLTVNWTESVTVQDHSRHTPTPTTAQTKLSSTAVTAKQLDTKNTSNKEEEEETEDNKTEDKKTELGKKKSL